MKTLVRFLAAATLIVAAIILVNCADPLEPEGLVSPTVPNDTVVVTDTVIHTDTVIDQDTIITIGTIIQTDTGIQIDTVIGIDTVIVVDTINQTDTIIVVDTIIITPPDTCCPLQFCAQLSPALKESVWLLQNEAGRYRLEFAVAVDEGQPPKTLRVSINGEIYTWLPQEDPIWVLELDLPAYTVIRIKPDVPLAHGHEVNVCLKPTAL